MVIFQPRAAGVEHYRSLFRSFSYDYDYKQKYATNYAGGPQKATEYIGGAPIQLKINMVKQVYELDTHDKRLYAISRGASEAELACTILFLHCIDPRLRHVLIDNNFFYIPLEFWHIELKNTFEQWRRSGMVGHIKDETVWQLRQLVKCTIRIHGDADWETEFLERQNRVFFLRQPFVLNSNPYYYYERLWKHMQKLAHKVVNSVGEQRALETLDEWWQARHHATPGGSTSLRRLPRDTLVKDSRLRAADRPTKKATVETLDDSYIWQALTTMPRNLARGSTKPEPGKKLRALLASLDDMYFIAAYASAHVEKELRFDGMVGKQTPNDVVEWTLAGERGGHYWCSADFSNFNIEHAMFVLLMLSHALGEAWLKRGDKAAYKQRALCEFWIGQSYCNSWVSQGGEWQRVFNGLFSGHRNTARDNTLLHRLYYVMAQEALSDGGFDVRPSYEAFCGDDEDVRFSHPLDAAAHVATYQLSMHVVKSEKQLAGEHWHEFLRLISDPVNMPERPLASILSTLATGNWYVERALWYNSVVASTTSNWWDAVCRGMPLGVGQKMCGMYLDILMRQKKGDKWHDLEWWSFRKTLGGDHLWQRTIGGWERPPKLVFDVKPDAVWPSRASEAWMERMRDLLELTTKDRREQYRHYLLKSSYNSTFHTQRMKMLNSEVELLWPPRHSRARPLDLEAQAYFASKDQWMLLLYNFDENQKPVTMEEVYARIGLDSTIVNLVGWQTIIKRQIPARQWIKYETPAEPRVLSAVAAYANAAYRYVASYTMNIPPQWVVKNVPTVTHIAYILAPNAAGKSWFCARHPDAADLDVLVHKYTGFPEYKYEPAKDDKRVTLHTLVQIIVNGVKDGYKIFAGQWQYTEFAQAAELCGLSLLSYMVQPEQEILHSRQLNRGWDSAKIADREKRFSLAKRGFNGEILSSFNDLLYLRL